MTTPLQDKLIADWVSALRSGEYKQAKNSLYNSEDKGFCCLGVAAVLIGATTDEIKESATTAKDWYVTTQETYGLVDALGCYPDGALYVLNDAKGADFNEIADVIESRPEGLFV